MAAARMAEDYVRPVGRVAHLRGWPLVSMHPAQFFAELPAVMADVPAQQIASQLDAAAVDANQGPSR